MTSSKHQMLTQQFSFALLNRTVGEIRQKTSWGKIKILSVSTADKTDLTWGILISLIGNQNNFGSWGTKTKNKVKPSESCPGSTSLHHSHPTTSPNTRRAGEREWGPWWVHKDFSLLLLLSSHFSLALTCGQPAAIFNHLLFRHTQEVLKYRLKFDQFQI